LKSTIRDFYLMALLDFNNGTTVEEMHKTLKLYEKHEHYEACAGIWKAIREWNGDA